MPLRDHFRPPLGELRHWESFHARWAAVIADALEADLLPPGYFAEVQVHVGSTATATLSPQVWSPPAPGMVLPAVFPDRLEVLIFNTESGPTLVAAIELVSPRNKDREPTRRAFATKCANYLQQGIGLVLVDIVTNRRPNLHNEMIRLLELDDEYLIDPDSLYATAYRPLQREGTPEIQVWPQRLAVGEQLPTLPLPLDKGQCLRLDLEETYAEACRRTRLPDE